MADSKVFGIDLGTTYSVITTLDENGMPVVIQNQMDSSDLLASAAYFPEEGEPVVGEMAKSQKDTEPARVVEFVKRYIGKEDAPTYTFGEMTYDPITVSALYLKRMKAYAEEQGYNVHNVVITCPAYFGHAERAATMQAGEIAGLNVMNIVNEPTAAALNYCAREYNENRKIMVYDLGGGTFDVTLFDFRVDEDGKAFIDVLRSDGNDRLGGVDWDERLFDYICEKYCFENGTELSDMTDELKAIIRSLVEQTKKDLSQMTKKSVQFKYDGDRTRLDLTRAEFEEKTQDLVEQTIDFVRQLLSDVQLTAADVDLVLLVGGSTFMPMVRNAVEALFPGKVRIEQPNLAVGKGAALAAYIEFIETVKKVKRGEKLTEKEANIVPGGELTTEVIEELKKGNQGPGPVGFVDKLTRSLGPAVFVAQDRYMIDNLLFIGDENPAEAEATYGTRVDNAPEIVVNVYENVSEDRENKYVTPCYDAEGNPQYTEPELKVRRIGEVHLQLPPNTPKGSPIRVVFRSSTIGLEVTAENVETGETARVEILPDTGKTQEEVERAKEELKNVTPRAEI